MADPVHELQATVEVIDLDNTVEFMGEQFRMSDRIGLMPLMRFAMTARKGVKSDDLDGLAAMYALIRDCIDATKPQRPVLDEHGTPQVGEDGQPVTEPAGPSEWDRFETHAIDTKADADDMFKVVTDVIQRLSARPTRRPGDSSAGPRNTSDSSKVISSTSGPAHRVPDGVGELVSITDLLQARSTA